MRVTGVVLAGGLGERLGEFKPLVRVGGETLVSRALDALAPLVDETLLLHGAPENRARLLPFATRARLAPDPAIGPLGALAEACRLARGEWLLVTPCDVPWKNAAALRALLEAAAGRDGAAYGDDAGWNPVLATYRRDALAAASEAALSQGERSAQRALAKLDLARLRPPADLPGDIDTPADLEQARRRTAQ